MEDELRTLHEAMVMKERLRVLARLQADYLAELVANGLDNGVAEQLMIDWSRQAFGQTFRSIPEASLQDGLDELLDDPSTTSDASQVASPDRVPFGENWLQLVEDVDDDAADDQAA